MAIPIVSVEQMREWERATWATGVTQESVMRQAAAAVARVAEHLTRAGDSILALAGKGHNGDDAAYAAEFIRERKVRLLRVIEPEISANELKPLLAERSALLIDGLFGIGLNRVLSKSWIGLIEQINQARLPVLAVDVPSGLNADDGVAMDKAIYASVTVTLAAVKRGFLKSSAWPFVGKLEVAPDIGLAPCPLKVEMSWIIPGDFDGFPPPRPRAGHKGTFGHLAIIAGSVGYHGAAVLAARGAQRAQPGLITVLAHEPIYPIVASQLQAVMVHPWTDEPSLPAGCTAVVVGPGLAAKSLPETLKGFVQRLWMDSPLPMVVDASALEWLPPGAGEDKRLRVITPHPGEAARLLKISSSEVQSDRGRALLELSKRWNNCRVVLKGHQTMIGRNKAPSFVNSSGNPQLAQGGSGDLLAGYLGGLLAQPALQSDPAKTLCFGAWQHGAAADALAARRPSWIVEDLAQTLGATRL